MRYLLLVLGIFSVFIGCNKTVAPDSERRLIEIPEGFPAMPVPADNPLTEQKIVLGRHLFYDARLSLDNSVACASCHRQEHGFADAASTSIGVNKEIGVRNSPAIANSGYAKALFFDGRAASLDEQILAALTNSAEMRSSEKLITERLRADENYRNMFRSAFNDTANARYVVKAIACFVRSVVSGNSPYDRFNRGDSTALSPAQRRGMTLFFGERARCSLCHSSFNFTDEQYHSTGLYTHYYDDGRYDVTRNEKDRGTFRTPTLRNIALTAPYMHDGETFTLEEVMQHYNKGGRNFFNKSPLIVPLRLTEAEMSDIIAFLHSLTDEKLITNPNFSKP